jgi:hypothetical protein
MTTVDTTETNTSRLPQELLMTLLTYQATFPNRHFQADQNPLHQAKWRAAMYCTISTRTTETDQRRLAKKAQIQISHSWTRGEIITTAFCKAFGLGHWHVCLCPGFSFSFSLCLDFTFSKGRAGEATASILSSFVVCVLLLYTPQTHPGLLHVRRATRMRFFVLHLMEE